MKVCECLNVKAISWPWPKVVYIQQYKPYILRNYFADLNQFFFMKAFRYKEMKIWRHDAGHMTKMAVISIYDKHPLKIFKNRQVDFHETRYVASETPAHHSLFKWWPSSDFDLFYSKVKFGYMYLRFSMGKSENSGLFRNYCSLWPESW